MCSELKYQEEDFSAGFGKDNYEHNRLRQKLTSALFRSGESIGRVHGRDFVMRLGNNGFTPDMSFIALDRLTQLKDYYLDGAADLIIEVILPGHGYADKVAKKAYYQSGGVSEYWLVDPLRQQIEFWRNQNGEFQLQQLDSDGCYRTPHLLGLDFAPALLFSAEDFELDLFRLETTPKGDRPKIHYQKDGLGWGELSFQPVLELEPTPISFEQYICWTPEAKFEFFDGQPDIGGKTGIRNLIGLLLMSFGLRSSVKVLPLQRWCDALLRRLDLEGQDEERKTLWWQQAREIAAIIRENFTLGSIGVIGDLTKPEPLSYWSEITLVVRGFPEDKRCEMYSVLREIEADVPHSVIDVERDYLTSEQKRDLELSMTAL